MKKPRLLDIFCGGGGAAVGYSRAGFEVVGVDSASQLSNPAFKFTDAEQQAFHIGMVKTIMLRFPVEFEVFKSVIVLNAIHVMNLLSLKKATTKMLSHYKAMFVDISVFPCHWIVGAIRRQFNFNVAEFSDLTTTLPSGVSFPYLVALLRGYFTSARSTTNRLWLTITQKLPPLFTTIDTGVPDIFMPVLQSYLVAFNNIPNLHTRIITQSGVNYNG